MKKPRRYSFSKAVAIGVLTSRVLWPLPVLADSSRDSAREEAAEHFDRGLSYVDRREFSLAIQEFKRAYEIGEHFGVLYNLGLAYAAVGQYGEALRTLEAYLSAGEAELHQGRRVDVRALIQQYEMQLAKVRVVTLPATAEVFIDGERLDARSVALDPGRHVISARADGHLESRTTIDLTAAEDREVALTLRPVASASVPSVGEAVQPAPVPKGTTSLDLESSKPNRTLAYLLGGTAVLLGGAAFGIFLHNNARFEDWKRKEDPANELRQSIETWDNVALGTGIAAGATLGAATVLWLATPNDSTTRVGAFVGFGVAGVRGAF